MENFEHANNTHNQSPEMVILGMMNEAMVQGRNDSERSDFEDILNKLRNKELSGTDAIVAAQAILEKKQDYN